MLQQTTVIMFNAFPLKLGKLDESQIDLYFKMYLTVKWIQLPLEEKAIEKYLCTKQTKLEN